MTIEQQEQLSRELNGAMQTGEKTSIDRAMANILLALMDCQRKTSERVKEMLIEQDRKKQRMAGFKFAIQLLKYLVASGAGAAVIKLLGM